MHDQARPASAKTRQEGKGIAVNVEEAVAAAEEEWSGRLNSALALNQDLEARVAELQKQGSRMRRSMSPVINFRHGPLHICSIVA